MKVKEKKKLDKKNWQSSFMIIGEAKVNEFTYKLDEKSEKSDWIYNVMNLGIDCGEKYGTVYAEMMGGYGAERDNVIYVHGKKDDGTDDYDNRFTIDWDDRNDEEILETIGKGCFLTVGLEVDKKGKTFYKKFLSSYDAIAYINEHLEDGTVVNVKGDLHYQLYNDNVMVKKQINSIVLSQKEKDGYHASFIQSILLNSDSVGTIDKDKGILPIYATVLEYMKEYNGKEVKQLVPLKKTFEYEVDVTNKTKTLGAISQLFKVKKGYTEITFEGKFVESGSTVKATMDDVPDDIKALIDIGVFTEEEALAKCAENGGKERKMVLTKPVIKMVGDDNKVPKLQKFEEKYSDDDLVLDFMIEDNSDDEDTEEEEEEENTTKADAEDEDWLKNL